MNFIGALAFKTRDTERLNREQEDARLEKNAARGGKLRDRRNLRGSRPGQANRPALRGRDDLLQESLMLLELHVDHRADLEERLLRFRL